MPSYEATIGDIILAATPEERSKAMRKHHGYLIAKEGILDNTMHTIEAVGLLRADLDFNRECDLNYILHGDREGTAHMLINKWRATLFADKEEN